MNKTLIALAAASTLFSGAAFAQYVPGSASNDRAADTQSRADVARNRVAGPADATVQTYGYPNDGGRFDRVSIPGSVASQTAAHEAERAAVARRPAVPGAVDRPGSDILVPGSTNDHFRP